MNRAQKIARFNLKVVGLSGPLSLLMIAVSWIADQIAIVFIGFGILSVAALIMALSPLFIKKEPGQVNFDERDAIIEKKVHLVGYCTLWCIFIATCTIPVFAASSILTAALPAVLAVALVTVKSVESIAILVQYGWSDKGEKS